MAVPFDPTDPVNLSPEQRLHELSSLLALGLRHLMLSRAQTQAAETSDSPPESSATGLDVSRHKSVHVPRG